MGHANMPGMPHIPDPMKDLLPPKVRQAMGMGGPSGGGASDKAKKLDLSFPALRELPGWSELPESKQQMFEVEAAQLHNSGHFALDSEDAFRVPGQSVDSTIQKERALAALTVHPKISAALKRFMLECFEAATAQNSSTNNN